MINFTNKQKRYVVTPTVPEGTVYINYFIYWGSTNTPIYSGKCRYFGEIEVDLTDWVEWVYSKYNGNGVMTYYGDLIVDFVFIDEDGTEHQGPEDRYTVSVEKDDPMIEYEPSVNGIVDIEAPFNDKYKAIIGTKPQYVSNYGLWVYPVFYLINRISGKIGRLDCSQIASNFNIVDDDINIAEFWTDDTAVEDKTGYDLIYAVINNILDNYNANEAIDNIRLNDSYAPHICYDGNVTEYFSTDNWNYHPLTWFWDMEDFGRYNDGKYSDILSHPFSIRYTEQELKDWYINNIPQEVRSKFYPEILGYGYSVIYIYPKSVLIPYEDNIANIRHFTTGMIKDGECPYFNLLLINSDFQGDINVPLAVNNSVLRGKTVNNLDKISFMDRYGDTHNASVSNSYELECYVDPDWLKTSTGNDLGYEALMLAMQSARKTFLIGTAKVSGMRTDGFTMLNCRVKDVEKVETYSRYNGTHRVPSLKITIEIYK